MTLLLHFTKRQECLPSARRSAKPGRGRSGLATRTSSEMLEKTK